MIPVRKLLRFLAGLLIATGLVSPVASQQVRDPDGTANVIDGMPADVFVQIMQAEDTRQWDAESFGRLLENPNRRIRLRAVQAAGRIGDEGAVPTLRQILASDTDDEIVATAACALGEIESASATDALLNSIRLSRVNRVRAPVVEALGKIASSLPDGQADVRRRIGDAILGVLSEQSRQAQPDRQVTLMALTAALRALRSPSTTSSSWPIAVLQRPDVSSSRAALRDSGRRSAR